MNELSGEYSGLYWCAISVCASFCEGKTERIFGIYSLWDVLLSPGRLCNQFFYGNLCADALVTSVEITPVCEEILKFLPFLLWLLIFEPQQEEILSAAMFIAIGFATFEKPPPGPSQIRYFPFWIAFRSSQQRIHMKEICLIICRQRTL